MDQPDPPRPASPAAPRPMTLTLAAASTALQALVLLVLAVLELVHLTPGRATMSVTTTVFLFLAGAGVGVCAWGLARRRSWARGPVVLAQLIALGLAWNARDVNPALSLGLTAVAVVTLVAVLSRPSRVALEESPG